jgi:CRISPR-associated protein Cmr2
MNNKVLHFSLGPVQGFVSQARRTRDLWAGSFLLSWLAGQAMTEVRRQGGDIVFPAVGGRDQPTDPLVAAIEGEPLPTDPHPSIGSLPNRFKAAVPEDFDTERVTAAVQQAWRTLAEAVWSAFVEQAAKQGDKTRAIWDRQIDSFWEIAWVQGDDPGDGSDGAWLEARKNWRAHWPEPEGGDHCALMGDFQELSGHIRVRDSKAQNDFWDTLKRSVGHLELRDNERLCAIALVKRLFPRLPKHDLEKAIGWVPGGKPQTIGNWPSTAYMAAIPWLRGFVDDTARIEQLRAYESAVVDAAGKAVRGERSTYINSLNPLGDLAWLDGNFFLPTALENADDTPLDKDESARRTLLDELNALQMAHPAQPYYALLLLDGDSLGKHLRAGDPSAISKALGVFSGNVAEIVAACDGVSLYAGGDDVLALLAHDRALECAVRLREAYGKAFGSSSYTASVAIVFAHFHLPLREVMAEAHRQLDDIAKDRNGRDSIALSWFKASGKAAEWVACWRDAQGDVPIEHFRELTACVQKDDFGTGFFYKLTARYPWLGDNTKHSMSLAHAERLLQAEYLKTRERSASLNDAENAVRILLAASRQSRRDETGAFVSEPGLQLDALRLARLLADKEART